MAAPKLKTNSLISDLRPSLDAGRLLISDLEKQKLLREARAIPELYQALAIEGMIHFLDGKPRLGTEALERSIDLCPGDGVTWTNYSAILTNKALYTQQEDLLERALQRCVTNMFVQALAFGAFWGDMSMMTKAFNLIEKYSADTSRVDDALETYEKFKRLDDSVSQDVKNAALVVRDIAENRGIVCMCSHIESDDFGDMAFTCEIEIDDADFLTELNNIVIDEMVARGYETGRCVAYFESWGDA